MAILEVKARQSDSTLKTDEGDENHVSSTRLGQLFTTGWKQKLMLAGMCYRVTPGAVTAGADITQITGGGGDAVMDLEQPEIAIGVDGGYYLIPIEIDVACQANIGTDADYTRILAIMDRTNGLPTTATGTLETPANLLDGGPSFPGRAWSAITTDILDPTMDELLAYRTRTAYHVSSANTVIAETKMHYEPKTPSIAKGPCGLYVYWFGSTVAATGLASIVVAAIPSSWVE